MVDSHVVLARVDKIRECLARLQTFALIDEKSFLRDPAVSGSAERNLQVAIQAVIDIGNHIVADKDLGPPKDYKDIFRILSKHLIISRSLAKKLGSMAGMRNVLVHDYLEVDVKLVYKTLKKDLGDFEKFIKAVLKLI